MRKNIELIRTVRSVIGDDIDLMADVYMGWTFEYAKRMMRLIDNENLRWLEEPVIADDIDGYADLKASCRTPISGGEHEYTLFGFRQLLEKKAVDVVQFDTNRVGGITQAHKICALAEAFQIPVIPHAGQVHNFHISMSSINAPIVEYFPFWPVEIGNELFWYIFDGEPQAKNGFVELDESKYGLGIELSKKYLDSFDVTE
jgi:L-alanine-DL-glutamate epimerase-like enolase superfamily enzyme